MNTRLNSKLATKFFHRKRSNIHRNLPIFEHKSCKAPKSYRKCRKISCRKEKTSQIMFSVCSFGPVECNKRSKSFTHFAVSKSFFPWCISLAQRGPVSQQTRSQVGCSQPSNQKLRDIYIEWKLFHEEGEEGGRGEREMMYDHLINNVFYVHLCIQEIVEIPL